MAHVQRVAQLLQQVSPGRVLLVLLAVVVLLRHAGVVEPGVAQLAVAVRVAALAGWRGGRRPLRGALGSRTAGGLLKRRQKKTEEEKKEKQLLATLAMLALRLWTSYRSHRLYRR